MLAVVVLEKSLDSALVVCDPQKEGWDGCKFHLLLSI